MLDWIMDKSCLGDRMKRYEAVSQHSLLPKVPVIARFDGKAFHTFTKGLNKPWDDRLFQAMQATALTLCQEIQGACFAYTQSDEISVLLTDMQGPQSQG